MNWGRGVVLGATILISLVAVPVSAQRSKPMSNAQLEAAAKRYKVGQLVEINDFGKWVPGEVTSVDGVFIHVKTINDDGTDGSETTGTARDVRGMAAEKAAKVKKLRAAAAAKPKAEPATQPEAEKKVAPAKGAADAGKAKPVVPGGVEGATDPLAYVVPTVTLTPASWKGARAVKLDDAVAWTYKPAAAAPKAVARIAGQPLTLPSAYPAGDERAVSSGSPERFLPLGSPDGKQLRLVWKHVTEDQSRVQIVDVGTGRVVGVSPLPGQTVLMDVSPDGKRLLLRSNPPRHMAAGTGRLHVYEIAGPNAPPKHVVSFAPYGEAGERDDAKVFGLAAFTDDQHVLVASTAEATLTTPQDTRVALWNLDGVKAEYVIDTGKAAFIDPFLPALDPSRSLLAMPTAKGLYLVETMTGKLLGRLAGEGTHHPAFDAAGRRLSGMPHDGRRVMVWDLASGQQTYDVPLQRDVVSREPPVLLDGDYAMLDNGMVIDLKAGIAIWQYGRGGSWDKWGPFVGASRSIVMDGAGWHTFALTSFTMPHLAAKQRGVELAKRGTLVLQPGMRVSIETDIAGGPADIRDRAVRRVTQQLTALGFAISPQPQPLKVVIRTKPGESKQQKFQGFGAGGGGLQTQTATINTLSHSVTFELNGQVVAGTGSAFNGIAIANVKPGETIQSIVDRQREDSYKWYDTVTLEPKAVKSIALLPPGESGLKPEGLEDHPLRPIPEQPAPAVADAPAARPKPNAKSGDGLD
jgi:hypothetical protein